MLDQRVEFIGCEMMYHKLNFRQVPAIHHPLAVRERGAWGRERGRLPKIVGSGPVTRCYYYGYLLYNIDNNSIAAANRRGREVAAARAAQPHGNRTMKPAHPRLAALRAAKAALLPRAAALAGEGRSYQEEDGLTRTAKGENGHSDTGSARSASGSAAGMPGDRRKSFPANDLPRPGCDFASVSRSAYVKLRIM